MYIRCPKCKANQMTKGRMSFPCRFCGTIMVDPREDGAPTTDKLVELDEVLRIARRMGVYKQMRGVLALPKYEKGEVHADSKS